MLVIQLVILLPHGLYTVISRRNGDLRSGGFLSLLLDSSLRIVRPMALSSPILSMSDNPISRPVTPKRRNS
ncbi:hypothetical protein BsWGS_00224 [Bradybaena similaris]